MNAPAPEPTYEDWLTGLGERAQAANHPEPWDRARLLAGLESRLENDDAEYALEATPERVEALVKVAEAALELRVPGHLSPAAEVLNAALSALLEQP